MKLRRIGHFYELSSDSQRQEIRNLRGSLHAPLKQKALRYLRSGVNTGIVMMVEYDHSSMPEACLGSVGLMSDGKWIWPSSLAYYVETYDLGLPADFLEDMANNDWSVPPDTKVPFEVPEGHVAM